MAKYDVYPDPRGSDNLLLCVQADLFDPLGTRMVVPLLPEHPRRTPLRKLNPVFAIDGVHYAMHTELMLAVPARVLTTPVANLKDRHDELVAALDFLFQGF